MAEDPPSPEQPPPPSTSSSSSNFWQLISGVANDLDLMLHDLFPDAALLAEGALSPDDPLLNHASILERLATSTPLADSSSNPPSPAPSTPPPPPDPSPIILDPSPIILDPSPSSSSVPTETTTDQSGGGGESAGCELGLLERLIRSHAVWFLPDLGRAGATHLLQGREIGTFLVRGSSKPGTMALSVRLPNPHVEHYLLEPSPTPGEIRLEGSAHSFHAIPTLICHYCQCCDELPARLRLPQPLLAASNRQELSSLALLGQDFWSSAPSSGVPPGLPHTIPPPANRNSFKTASLTDLSSSPPPIPQTPKPRPTPPPPPPPRSHPPPEPKASTPKKTTVTIDGYFCSSLADKISDYEDIWPERLKEESQTMVSQETQTDKVENNSSLFYSEPIDSVANRHHHHPPKMASLYRFSDPSLNGSSSFKASLNGEVTNDGGLSISSSFENLTLSSKSRPPPDNSWLQELRAKIQLRTKTEEVAVHKQDSPPPPSTANNTLSAATQKNWTLDSSWEWLGNEADSDEEGKGSTVHELIVRSSPDLQVTSNPPPRISEYDNLEEEEEEEEARSESWDLSQRYESLLKQAGGTDSLLRSKIQAESDSDSVLSEDSRTFQERLEPLLAAQRVVALRSKVGENIRSYVFRLAEEKTTTFAKSIEHFIQCTKESPETSPAVVMRNIRQFMTGMKNYLVKHGEGQFEQLVQQERSKLKADEFLNIDAILEGALHRLVIKPLKTYIYQLFVSTHSSSGALRKLSEAIKFARARSPQQMGITCGRPSGEVLEMVRHFLNRLQQAYSPLRKLENLLAAIAALYSFLASPPVQQQCPGVGAEEFLPVFMWAVVRCGMLGAEIEADYMWALLHPSLLAGEAGYYLATLSSAVHILKALPPPSPAASPPLVNGPGGEGFLRLLIPDEVTGSLLTKTLPLRPNMTTRDIAKMIAHKFRVTNPQDYGLFRLVKGEEIQLQDGDCPPPEGGTFAYKRCDARFVWPVLP